MEESVLVRQCLDGSERACKELFDRHSATMFAICMRYSDNQADAEDNLQDGFIKVFQNLQNWRSTGPIGAWIRKIMINTCLTRQKSAYKMYVQSTYDDIPEPGINPEVLSQIGIHEIETLIQTMPSGYRTVFNLNIIEGYSYEEISGMLNVTESTCRSQLFKAKNFLAKKIEALNPKIKLSL